MSVATATSPTRAPTLGIVTPPATPTGTTSPSGPGSGPGWKRSHMPAPPSTRPRRWPPSASPASGTRSCVMAAEKETGCLGRSNGR